MDQRLRPICRRYLRPRRDVLVVLCIGGALIAIMLNIRSASLLLLSERSTDQKTLYSAGMSMAERTSWPEYEESHLMAHHRHRLSRGCLERPLVGTVKANGTQRECDKMFGPRTMFAGSRIAKIVHQTYKTLDLHEDLKKLSATWVRKNPGWEVRHYNDADCLAIVRAEFPQYLEAYVNLPKPVERADFFRYLVVLRYGGVYADMDTECRAPVDSYVSENDTLVAGWENEFPSYTLAVQRDYSRKSQLLQWVFAGAAGHPALAALCDRINDNAKATNLGTTNMDTLDRTGPGVWTDAVLGYAIWQTGQGLRASQKWPVRLLPRIAFGAFDSGGFLTELPAAIVLHHFRGSWKTADQSCQRWSRFFLFPSMVASQVRGNGFRRPPTQANQLLRPFAAYQPHWWRDLYIPHVSGFMWSPDFFRWSSRSQLDACLLKLSDSPSIMLEDMEQHQDSVQMVSVAWLPPFDIIVHQMGVEAFLRPDGDDISTALTAVGLWQAGWYPQRAPPLQIQGPTVQQALLSIIYNEEPLEERVAYGLPTASQPVSPLAHRGLLIDVGAGLGLFSLAAAAKGMRVLAIEHEKGLSDLMQTSIRFNGWQSNVSIVSAVVGGEDGLTGCARVDLGLSGISRAPGALPHFHVNEWRWMHKGPPMPAWTSGGNCIPGQQRPLTTSRLDALVIDRFDQWELESGNEEQPEGVTTQAVTLRLSALGSGDVLSGAGKLLAGILSPRLAAPSVILLEAQMSDLHRVAEQVRLLEDRYGFTGGLFHRGSNCDPPDGRRAGGAWCQCRKGQFVERALQAVPSALLPQQQSQTPQPEPSFNVVLLHSKQRGTPEGTKWIARMAYGSIPTCLSGVRKLATAATAA